MDHTPNIPTNTEIWKDIPGFEGCYQASTFGQIRSVDRVVAQKNGRTRFAEGRILRILKGPGDYISVALSKNGFARTRPIHHLIMLTFVGPRPEKYEINHRDTNKANNRLDNLEYVTSSDNTRHAFAHGLYPVGSAHTNAKLDEQTVHEIKQQLADGYTLSELARRYGVGIMTISRIKHGKAWKHVQ